MVELVSASVAKNSVSVIYQLRPMAPRSDVSFAAAVGLGI